jgi:hypothetical protein
MDLQILVGGRSAGPGRAFVQMSGLLFGLWAAVGLCRIALPATGLRAQYFANASWSGPPARVDVDRTISTRQLSRGWRSTPPDAFSVRWSGYLLVGRSGDYTFTLTSDDGSQLYLDGALVVDNGGTHGPIARSGRVRLESGSHAIVLEYVQIGGPYLFEWSWAIGDEPTNHVPDWRLSPRRSSYGVLLAQRWAGWLWPYVTLAALVIACYAAFSRVRWPVVLEPFSRPAVVDSMLILVSLVVLYFTTPFAIEGDGAVKFDALSELLANGALSRMAASMIGPLASAPLWWIGSLHGTSDWWCARFNFLLFVLGLTGFYFALTPQIDRRIVLRFLLILTVASMFPHHNSRYYGEVFTALLVAVGLACVTVKGTSWGWAPAVIGAANTPASVVGLAIVAIERTLRRRELRHLVPVVAAVGLVIAEAWWRRGAPFVTGYEGNAGARTVLPYSGRPGFSYPFFFGLLSILLSFGKGIFFFAPGLLLLMRRDSASARPERDLELSWLLFLSGLVLVYSSWWGWYGGGFWGPRFFLFASVPAAYGLARRFHGSTESAVCEIVGIACLMWSVWVGVNGLVYGFDDPEICTANHYALEFLCWYTPEYSALFRPLIVRRPLESYEYGLLAYFLFIALYLIVSRLIQVRVRKPRVSGS